MTGTSFGIRKAALAPLLALGLLATGCSQGTAPPVRDRSKPVPQRAPSQKAEQTPQAPRVPAFFETAAAARPLPRMVPPSRYEGYPVVQTAYRIAAEIPEVLAQQPCYCYCDRSAGHRGLADCWANDHGAG